MSAHPLEVTTPPGIALHVLPKSRNPITRWASLLTAVRRIVLESRPDVVHVHSLGSYALLAFGIPSGTPMVSTPWGSDIILDATSWWRRAIVGHTLRRSACYTCDAQHMRPRLAKFGVPLDRVHIINFGVETERFASIAADRPDWSGVGITSFPATVLRVTSLRSLYSVYDIPTLIRAAARLRELGIAVTIDIHGGGPLLEQLQRQVHESGLEDTVFFHGRYSHDSLPSILSGADVYVSTSTSDAGIAASTAEAMAAGVPAVISDSGENPAWITDGVNGRLFATGDDAALANVLLEAAKSPDKRLAWARAGQRTILDRNDYQTEMRKMEALYLECARDFRGL